MGNITIWLTPVWVLAAGMTLGMAVLFGAFGIVWLVSRRAGETIWRLVNESILLWISYVAIVFVAFFFVAIPIMPVRSIVHSLQRLPKVGTYKTTVNVPARTDDKEIIVNFESDELQSYTF